jgi:hypothetical protein
MVNWRTFWVWVNYVLLKKSGYAAALGRELPVRIKNRSNVFRERLDPRGIPGKTRRRDSNMFWVDLDPRQLEVINGLCRKALVGATR